ncbi:MAG: ARPP-1 family domain-containing protein [Candidatus Rokuibacteriota bacterium]
MNGRRRSFLRLLGVAGAAAVSAPTLALADRIRILPDAGASPLLPRQTSPELARALDGLTLGPAAIQGGLAVLWLHARDTAGGPRLEILTLDESRARGALTVIERAQASVPELIAENRGKTYVLLLAGEILIGGKQNRVLREDLLLPPLSGPRNIAVYCVEQGRWNEGGRAFESRGSVVQPSVRSQVLRRAEQSRIWSGIATASRSLRAPSPTGSYQAVYDQPEVKAHLERATRSFDPTVAPAAVGAAVFVGPSLAGVDFFHSADLFAREWPKLVRAYALDAYRAGAGAWDEPAARARTGGLLRAAARVEGSRRGSVGAGGLFEFTLDGRRGAALLFEGQALHVAIL